MGDRQRGRSPEGRPPAAMLSSFQDVSFTGFHPSLQQQNSQDNHNSLGQQSYGQQSYLGLPILQPRTSQNYVQYGHSLHSRRSGPLSRYSSGGEALFQESDALRQPMAVAELIAAIDQGTQSTRVYLFDTNFQPVASHQTTFTQIQPQSGWCEHDPLEVWASVQECLIKAHQEAEQKLGPSIKVVAMGLTNQRETTVVWSRISGQPLYNAIVWLDNRTGPICEEMLEKLGSKEYFRPVTGLPISTYFSAFKWKWLYDNVDHVRHAVDAGDACFGTMDSWLIYQLTGGCRDGVHVTDVSNASRTMLMNLETCEWHLPYLPLFSMPREALPEIRSNAEVYGFVSYPQHPAYVGVPISGCLGDQMSAVLGQRCQAGEAKNTYGTGCFTLLNTGPKIVPSTNGLLTTVSYKLGAEEPTQYALEGAVAVAGLGISWLKENLGVIGSPEEAEALAGTVTDTAGVYFVPAFSGLLAPHWDATARGAILGLTGFSTRAHVTRALLEAICWQTKEVLDAMRRDAGMDGSISVLRVDGGASRNNLLMQMQADFLQTQVLRPHFQETTCLGAALAAGLGAGVWTQAQVFGSQSYNNTKFQPQMSVEEMQRRYGKWQTAISRCRELATLHDEGPPTAK